MPFAGIFPSSAILLLLVLLADAQPVEGLMPAAGNATSTGAAEMCMCYQGSVFDGEARLVDKPPVAVYLDDGVLLPGAARAASSLPPWRAPSPTPDRHPAPPPILADTRATTPGAAPAHKKGLSWPAKAWVLAVAMLIVVFVSR
jgi:hypothetical protein